VTVIYLIIEYSLVMHYICLTLNTHLVHQLYNRIFILIKPRDSLVSIVSLFDFVCMEIWKILIMQFDCLHVFIKIISYNKKESPFSRGWLPTIHGTFLGGKLGAQMGTLSFYFNTTFGCS